MENAPRLWTGFVAIPAAIACLILCMLAYEFTVFPDAYWSEDPEWAYGSWRLMLREAGSIAAICMGVLFVALVAASLSPERLRDRLCIRRSGLSPLQVAVIALASVLVSILSGYVLWISYFFLPEFVWSPESFDDPFGSTNHVGGTIVFALATGIFPGIAEELLFRGYLQSRLLKRWPAPVAIGVTSLCFGAYHMNMEQLIAAGFMGLWLGTIAWRTGSVIPSIFAHATINVFVTGYAWYGYELARTATDLYMLDLTVGVIGIGCMYLAVRALWSRPAFRWKSEQPHAAPRAIKTLKQQVAESLDADPRLLPQMGEILQDLDALGSDTAALVELIESAGDTPGSALDLGCGKGALLLALAERGWRCHGVDGYRPFVEAARERAAQQGLADRCRFTLGDLRGFLESEAPYDLVICSGVGPFAGGQSKTLDALREHAAPGGLICIDDGYLAEGAPIEEAEAFGGYAPLDRTRWQLTATGASMIAERIFTAEETRVANDAILATITPRAEALARSSVGLESHVRAWLDEQRRQNDLLGRVLIPAAWLLRMPVDDGSAPAAGRDEAGDAEQRG